MYQQAKAVIERILAGRTFELPGDLDPENEVYVLPVSGGADSSALAVLMCTIYPEVPWRLMFTDTKAEEPELMATLDHLEMYLGRQIDRIVPEKGLYELVEDFQGFLPGHGSRWCTRTLKLLPFGKWLEQFEGKDTYFLVGIRADEQGRGAFKIDGVETFRPFVDLGLERADIFAILRETIGIPRFYRRRTRSGCSCCPFQRKSELIGLLQEQPAEFEKGMKYEKLQGDDLNRHPVAPSLSQETRIAGNWMHIPMPEHDERAEGKHVHGEDLFGSRVYVGVEFFMSGMPGYQEFIWHQRVVCYSGTIAGAKKQLDGRYQHLLETGEVYEMTPDEVRLNARFGLYYIELSNEVFDPAGPRGKSYTWKSGTSYAQLRHVVQWVTRALHAEGLRQEAAMKAKDGSVQAEWKEGAARGLMSVSQEVGQVIHSHWYKPQERIQTTDVEDDGEERSVPCPMCTI